MAAEVASVFAAWQKRDFSVDHRGWRPPPSAIEGPALPGIAGVVQAQHKMLVDLTTHLPTAMNLRRILASQTEVAHVAARHATHAAPDLVERFRERDQTYTMLVQASRDVGGLIGNGGIAAAESANALHRLRQAPSSTDEEATALRELARLFAGTDARVATTIEHGLEERLYLVSIKYPRIHDHERSGTILRPRERWVAVNSSAQTDLLSIARGRLRPPPTPSPVLYESVSCRQAYELTLAQQPQGRRPTGLAR